MFLLFHAPRTSLQMHEARHVGGYNTVWMLRLDVGQLVIANLGRNCFLGSRKRSSESAALIGSLKVDELHAIYALQQGLRLEKGFRRTNHSSKPCHRV